MCQVLPKGRQHQRHTHLQTHLGRLQGGASQEAQKSSQGRHGELIVVIYFNFHHFFEASNEAKFEFRP